MTTGRVAEVTAFLELLDAELAQDPRGVAVARVDLDRFVRFRETWGPSAARIVHSVLTSRLEGVVGSRERVLRFGAFGLVAAMRVDDPTAEALETVGMGIVAAVSAPLSLNIGPEMAVGSNVGIAAAAALGDADPLRLLAAAELALQDSCAAGSRRVRVFAPPPPPPEDSGRLPGLFVDMLGAVADRRFQPVYQPVVSLPDRTIRGAEALVRWVHPQYGSVPPSEFLAEADRSGLVRQIDSVVRNEACFGCASWPPLRELDVHVNLSAADLDAPALADEVRDDLIAAGLPAGRLVMNVPETALSEDWPRARRRLEALKAVGVRIAVDGFKAGEAFVERLDSGLFDVLKIDRSLVSARAGNGHDPQAVLSAVVAIGRALDLDVIAVGVESQADLDRVIEAGCEQAQGFLFSGPLSGPEMAHLVDTATRL